MQVTLPNSYSISSKLQGQLPMLDKLISKAKIAMVLCQLTSSSLISLGELYNDDCKVNLDKHSLEVCKDNDLIL